MELDAASEAVAEFAAEEFDVADLVVVAVAAL